jgi:formamidopyrimidine-DNA glycosylase
MPELPEVETIRADLSDRIVGRVFTGADLPWPGCVAHPIPEQFVAELPGHQVEEVSRRGKFLVLLLSNGSAALVVHLRMTGRLKWVEPGALRHRHLRAVLELDSGQALHFEDQRKFGRLYFTRNQAELASVLHRLGPEPLAVGFTVDAWRQRLAGRRGQLKPLLLDQRFLAGLGNIYVDEALFRARLHPLRRSETLAEDDVLRLREGVITALRQGIANRGTTLADYRDAWGTAGLNREQLLVFRREGKPCPACGTLIEKIRVAGRGTHVCPNCQPLP